MLGCPTEGRRADIDTAVEMCQRIASYPGNVRQSHVSATRSFPKAKTAVQWCTMQSEAVLSAPAPARPQNAQGYPRRGECLGSVIRARSLRRPGASPGLLCRRGKRVGTPRSARPESTRPRLPAMSRAGRALAVITSTWAPARVPEARVVHRPIGRDASRGVD